MFGTAILRALAEVGAGLIRIDPHLVLSIWDNVGFSREARHPETVRHIRRFKVEERRRGMRRVAQRNVQFVRGHDAELGISELPPPLMPDHANQDRIRRARSGLHRIDRAYGRQDQNENDQDRNGSPGEFYWIAAVDLRGLAAVVTRTLAKADDAVDDEARDDYEDHGANDYRKVSDRVDFVGRS